MFKKRELWETDFIYYQIQVFGVWITYRKESIPPYDNGWV